EEQLPGRVGGAAALEDDGAVRGGGIGLFDGQVVEAFSGAAGEVGVALRLECPTWYAGDVSEVGCCAGAGPGQVGAELVAQVAGHDEPNPDTSEVGLGAADGHQLSPSVNGRPSSTISASTTSSSDGIGAGMSGP